MNGEVFGILIITAFIHGITIMFFYLLVEDSRIGDIPLYKLCVRISFFLPYACTVLFMFSLLYIGVCAGWEGVCDSLREYRYHRNNRREW